MRVVKKRGPNKNPYTPRGSKYETEEERVAAQKEAGKRYRERNREAVLARSREHDRARSARRASQRKEARLANLEQARARDRASYVANRDARLAAGKRWYHKDPEHTRELARIARSKPSVKARAKVTTDLWRKNNPDKVRAMDERRRQKRLADPELMAKKRQEYRRYYYANKAILLPKISVYVRVRQARLRGAEGRFTPTEWRARYELYGGCCAYCSKPLSFRSATMDHVIPISKGGSNWPENLVPACGTCNKSKGNRLWTPREPGQNPAQLKSSGAISEST